MRVKYTKIETCVERFFRIQSLYTQLYYYALASSKRRLAKPSHLAGSLSIGSVYGIHSKSTR